MNEAFTHPQATHMKSQNIYLQIFIFNTIVINRTFALYEQMFYYHNCYNERWKIVYPYTVMNFNLFYFQLWYETSPAVVFGTKSSGTKPPNS
jgi:hypothetical protein